VIIVIGIVFHGKKKDIAQIDYKRKECPKKELAGSL